MFCTNCGAQIDDGSKFCTSCGSKIEVIAMPEAVTEPAAEAAEPVVEAAESAKEAVEETVEEVAGQAAETFEAAPEVVEEAAEEVAAQAEETVESAPVVFTGTVEDAAGRTIATAQETAQAAGAPVPTVTPQTPDFGKAPEAGQRTAGNGYSQNTGYQQASNQQYVQTPAPGGGSDSFGLVSMILGIASVVLSCVGFKYWWAAVLGLAAGIVGLVFASKAAKAGDNSGMRRAGWILSLIGIILFGLAIIILISCAACVGCAACAAANAWY